MPRINEMTNRWDSMSHDQKIQEVLTKSRLFTAVEAGDIETVGEIDLTPYFGTASVFKELFGNIVDAKIYHDNLLANPDSEQYFIDQAKKDYNNSVEFFKAMFQKHYRMLEKQKAEIEEFEQN